MTDKRIVLVSFANKYRGAQQVPCDLDCGTLCYEDPENVKLVRESNGSIVCVFCALKLKREHGLDLDLKGQLWRGAIRKPEPMGEVNKLLMELLEKKKG